MFKNFKVMTADQLLKAYQPKLTLDVVKAGKTGEGSRGGKIIGHTKSGKAIYGPSAGYVAAQKKYDAIESKAYRAFEANRPTRALDAKLDRIDRDLEAHRNLHAKLHEGFTSEEHRSAQRFHEKRSTGSDTSAVVHRQLMHTHRAQTDEAKEKTKRHAASWAASQKRSKEKEKERQSNAKAAATKKAAQYRAKAAEHRAAAKKHKANPDVAAAHKEAAAGYHELSRLRYFKRDDEAYTEYHRHATKHAAIAARLSKKSFNEENDMQTDKLEDLFKSELNPDEEKVLIECPHCDAPITKSEVIAKAKKGSSVDENAGGGLHRGPASGKNSKTPVRTGMGAKKHDKANPSMHAKKSDEPEVIDETVDEAPEEQVEEVAKGDSESCADVNKNDLKKKEVKKSEPTAPVYGQILSGSRHVHWVQGDDEAIAKSIAEGSLGQGAIVRAPIDKNNAR